MPDSTQAPVKTQAHTRVAVLYCAGLCAAALIPFDALTPPAFGATPPGPQSGQRWELLRNDHGIVVHRRTVPGSHLHEFRGVGIIEAPIATILAVLDDADHRKEWMSESVANYRVERIDPYSEVFYSRTGAPWPIADRDIVCRTATTIDPVARLVHIEITSTSHPNCPPHKGVVRMPFLRGHWYLWPEHDGAWTRAEYQIHVDLGGSLPDWIMNRVSRDIPYDTLMGMRKQIKRRHYADFEKMVAQVTAYQMVIGAVTQAASN